MVINCHRAFISSSGWKGLYLLYLEYFIHRHIIIGGMSNRYLRGERIPKYLYIFTKPVTLLI
jgi:hypothetical protein